MTLVLEGDTHVVRVGTHVLMSSRMHGSEQAMAELACPAARGQRGLRALVGGLGMGFTLRAVLDLVATDAEVVVCELVDALVAWNRGPLAHLAGAPLADPRVHVHHGDFVDYVLSAKDRFHAILVDIDNGPEALTSQTNARLYRDAGLRALHDAVVPGGVVVIWSAFASAPFEKRMSRAGFDCEARAVHARGPAVKKGGIHTLYVGRAK
jgi:spermidine synthase